MTYRLVGRQRGKFLHLHTIAREMALVFTCIREILWRIARCSVYRFVVLANLTSVIMGLMKPQLQIILLLIHVPFLIGYVAGLRIDPVYQFGPVAWGIVALLFWRRNGGRTESGGRFLAVRGVVDVVCLVLAVVTGEFAFGLLGGLVWVHAFLAGHRDKLVDTSVAYLTTALLFTVHLPFAAFDGVLNRMTLQAVILGSWILDQFHYLHFTTSQSVVVSGSSFELKDVCEGAFSVPALLCCAFVLQCVMRRRWIHAMPSVLGALFTAVLMQAAALCAIVIVWQEYGVNASTGAVGVMLSAAVFACGVLAVISADVLLSVFTEPVPLMATTTVNPLAIFWNRMFWVPARVDAEDDADEVIPEIRVVLDEAPSVPRMLGPWAGDFLFSWFITRSRGRMIVGLPCVVLAIAGVVLWTNAETPEQINGRYDAALADAVEQNREADLELAVQRLQQSNVDTFAIRFRRVQWLISLGKKDAAVSHLNALTPLNGQGYVPARLLLVKQSDQADPLIPLSEEQRQQQLQRAVQERPTDAEVHLLLGKGYLWQRQTRLAEFHVTTAAEIDPNHLPDLLVLQKGLGRSSQDLIQQSSSATQKLNKRLAQNSGDQQTRLSLARIMALLGDTQEAESLLKDGLEIEKSTELKRTLSALYTGMATEQLKNSLKHAQAVKLGQQAILLNPENTNAISVLDRAIRVTGTVDPAILAPAVDHWRRQVEADSATAQDRLHLTRLLTVCGQFDEAIAVHKPIASGSIGSRAMLARLFVMAGRPNEAREVTDVLLKELGLEASPDENKVVLVARVLLIEKRLQEVVDLVEVQFIKANRVPSAELAGIYVGCMNALFDRKAAADDLFVGTDESLMLMQRVHNITPGAATIAPRLAKIAVSEGVAAQSANDLILEILAQGTLNATVHSAVGAEAIVQQDLEKAVVSLQQAHALSPNDPVILNNLAIALVRQSKDNADRALGLAEQALSILPDHIELLATRGEIQIVLNRLADARRDLSAVLDRDPKHELALQLLAGIAD